MKLSLHVVPPPRDAPALPALTVRLSEPMLRFRCNQKGCCCSGWDIPFRLEDFLRLHDRLPDGERAALGRGIQLVLEKGDREGEQILHSLKLDGVGEAFWATASPRMVRICSLRRSHATGDSSMRSMPAPCSPRIGFRRRFANGSRHSNGGWRQRRTR